MTRPPEDDAPQSSDPRRSPDAPSHRPAGTPNLSWPFDPLPPPHLVGDDDARAEIDAHIELMVDELVAAGHPPEEARREARERFGDPVAWRRKTRRNDPRRHGMTTMMMRLLQDLRFALRSFRRSPGFTVMAVLTLTVALAGNTALFSVLDSAVLQALPFPESDRLVFINGVHRTADGEAQRMASVPEFRDWRERTRTVDPLVATGGATFTLTGGTESERVSAETVSEGYFQLLGGSAALGRTFSADEHALVEGPLVAVLGHALWERAFGADRSIVGRTVTLNDRSVEVVGVMPEGFGGVNLDTEVWTPLAGLTLTTAPDILESRGTRFLPVIGRLSPDADLEQAQTEFESIALQLQDEFPELNEDRFARIESFRDGYLETTGDLLWVLFGAGLLLVVIAGANVANLLLVRAHARTRELTVRRALGADSGRIVGQLLTESLLLAAVGGVLGLLGAQQLLRFAIPLVPRGVLPGYADPAISLRAFAFTLAVLLVVGVASGLTPAMASARRDLAGTLRGGRGSVRGRGNQAQKAFVVTQVGLALMLLVGAGLLGRSLRAQLAIDPGIEVAGLHALRVSPPLEHYPDAASLRQYADEVRRRVSEVPGVRAASLSSDVPFRGGSSGSYAMRPDDVETLIRVHRHSVDPGFFDLLGVELLAGRTFQPADEADAPGVVIVTRAFVERVFPEAPAPAAAVGRQVWAGNPADPDNLAEIVGVVDNVRFRNLVQSMLDGPNSPDLFYALAQAPARTHEVTFAAEGDEAAAIAGVRQAVQSLDPSTPPFAFASLDDLYRGQTAMPRLAALLMGGFSLFALSLSAVGIYGVLSFTVHQRAPEIALRRALGAEGGEVARRVVFEAVQLAGLGVALGGIAAFLASDLLESLLFQVQAGDPLTLVFTGMVLLMVAAAAAAVPALRAARREPAEVLSRD